MPRFKERRVKANLTEVILDVADRIRTKAALNKGVRARAAHATADLIAEMPDAVTRDAMAANTISTGRVSNARPNVR